MPKRAVTPEPGDDEPKYFTVVNPYPAHANLELIKDRKDFAFWLACIVGKNDLLAFFHRKTVCIRSSAASRSDAGIFERVEHLHRIRVAMMKALVLEMPAYEHGVTSFCLDRWFYS